MRIKPLQEKIVYDKNPLAEVVCQLRFDPLPIDDATMQRFNAVAADMGFPVSTFDQVTTFQFAASFSGERQHMEMPQAVPARVYHQSSVEGEWKVSHTSDFVALTCTRYTTWPQFEERLLSVYDRYRKLVGIGNSTRVGLRYRDIVDRQSLGLEDQPWTELIQPFLLGPLAASDIADGGVPEADVLSYAFQSNLRLEECGLLFQAGLARSVDGSRTAFVIDSDFYVEGDDAAGCMADEHKIRIVLTNLHRNASAMFAGSIKEKLRNALAPRIIK